MGGRIVGRDSPRRQHQPDRALAAARNSDLASFAWRAMEMTLAALNYPDVDRGLPRARRLPQRRTESLGTQTVVERTQMATSG
jgi:hypothetical protein